MLTPLFRVSYPTLIDPRAHGTGKPKYSVSAIFEDPTQLKGLKDAVIAAAKKEWPGAKVEDGKVFVENVSGKMVEIKMPFKLGNEEKPKDEAYADSEYMNISSYQGVPCVGPDKSPKEPADIYAGCYCKAAVTPSAYEVDGSKGVTIYLNAIQFIRDGDRLSGDNGAAVSEFEAEACETADFNGQF